MLIINEDITDFSGLPEQEFHMLKELLDQDQFELLEPFENEIRLVYLMNDAVESLLIFKDAVLTGEYRKDYEGQLQADLTLQGGEEAVRFALSVHQGDSVVTVFFRSLRRQVWLYNYARLGHFWVKGCEYLRQLEYHLAILRDKRDYMGEEYCNEKELELAVLTEFPPLNYCCYPAASPEYVVPSYPAWQVSKPAIAEMIRLAEEAQDVSMRRTLYLYRLFPGKSLAKFIAGQLHRVKHQDLVDLIRAKVAEAAALYPDRRLEGEENKRKILEAGARERKRHLEKQGKKVDLIYEEPFVLVRDSIQLQIHLMIWDVCGRNRVTEIETFPEEINEAQKINEAQQVRKEEKNT